MKKWECDIKPLILDFKIPSGTSRGVLTQKFSWLIYLKDLSSENIGIGECSIIKTLSPEWNESYESNLFFLANNQELLNNPNHSWFNDKPSIRFGLEMAHINLRNKEKNIYYPSKFTEGEDSIFINGLIWMGDKKFMFDQIQEKINQGFKCIKLKIGAIDFNSELNLLEYIRSNFSAKQIEIRVDANGAFQSSEALQKLEALSKFQLHSIEQPIKQGFWKEMNFLCKNSSLPIALDEELIGVRKENREKLIDSICPQFIILKPSLIGGFEESEHWISICKSRNIGWWITSALESNVGLNAIAQWTYTLNNKMYQGLGTGNLYKNNIESPIFIEKGMLKYYYKT